jgi:hypothetical protein
MPNYALSVLDDAAYQSIRHPGIKAALAEILNQIPTYRSQGTAVGAVAAIRELINDIVQGERGQPIKTAPTPAEHCELLLSDSTARVALGAVRAYLDTLSATNATAPLPSRPSFITLVRMIAEAI